MTGGHITFVSDGENVECVIGSDLKILPFSGLASVELEDYSIGTPYTPGAQTISTYVKPGQFDLPVIIPRLLRGFYLHFFRVGSTGEMTVSLGEHERYSEYKIIASKEEPATFCDDIQLTLTVYRAYPYWKDVDGFGENLGERVPLLWPGLFRMSGDMIIASYAKYDRTYAVTNTGEAAVGFYVIIKTTDTATNPQIILTDKANTFIRVGTTAKPVVITKDDELEISTIIENGIAPESRKDIFVRLNGENILNKTDQFSTFFQIEPGTHELSYTADEGAQTLQLWFWRNWVWSWV